MFVLVSPDHTEYYFQFDMHIVTVSPTVSATILIMAY